MIRALTTLPVRSMSEHDVRHIIAILDSDPNATVRITLEIDAEFPSGAKRHDQARRK